MELSEQQEVERARAVAAALAEQCFAADELYEAAREFTGYAQPGAYERLSKALDAYERVTGRG